MTTLTAPQATDIFRRPPDRWVDVGEGEVAVRTVGTGPDVLLVHGWPVSGATYRGLLPHLVGDFTCHVLDLVGAGQSRFTRHSALTLQLHVDSLRTVVDALDLDDVAVVGHDSGGLLARHAFAGHPRLRGMGLLNTEQLTMTWRLRQLIMLGQLPGFMRLFAAAAARPSIRRLPLVLGDLVHDPALLGGEFEELMLAPLHDDPDRRWAADRLIKSWDTGLIDALPDVHRRIDVPVALVWGEEDPYLPVGEARAMVGSFPDAELTVVPDTSLFVHEEAPARVAAGLRRALDRR